MKGAVSSVTMRLFVAAGLPLKTREALARQQAKFRRTQAQVSWVPSEFFLLSRKSLTGFKWQTRGHKQSHGYG